MPLVFILTNQRSKRSDSSVLFSRWKYLLFSLEYLFFFFFDEVRLGFNCVSPSFLPSFLPPHPDSRGTGDPSVFLSATESLSARLSDGTSPPAVLSVLCRLGALLRRREAEKLHTVLQEFTHTSTLPKGEWGENVYRLGREEQINQATLIMSDAN